MGVTIHRYARSNLGADLGELTHTHARNFRVELNDCGSGSFQIQNTDSQLAAIQYGDIVKFRIDGGPARFAMLVEKRRTAEVSQAEEFGQATEFSGPGTLAVLEEAVVFPEFPVGDDRVEPSSDARVFNFSSRYLDDATWVSATVNSPDDYGVPQDWPDVTVGDWIWDRIVTPSNVPIGDVYFRKTFTVGADKRVQVYVAADDLYEVWVDNQLLFSEERWYAGQSQNDQVDLDAGSHLIAIKAHNVNVAKAGIKVAVFGLGATNEPDTSDVVVESDSSWKLLAYPAEAPGFTPGRILEILLDEAQDRDALTDVGYGFSATNSSGGGVWSTFSDFAVRFGMSYLDVVRQMTQSEYANISMRAETLILDAFSPGTDYPGVPPLQTGTNVTAHDYDAEGG